MNLTKEELNRMAFLLGKSQHLILDEKEKNELRTLISIEHPCPLSFNDMIKLGMIIVGTNVILESYELTERLRNNPLNLETCYICGEKDAHQLMESTFFPEIPEIKFKCNECLIKEENK